MNELGWIGNALIIAGMLGVAHRKRWAFLLGAVGNSAYFAKGLLTEQPDLVFIEALVIGCSLYSWILWGRIKNDRALS